MCAPSLTGSAKYNHVSFFNPN
ncbi:hypothetical protein V12B01_13695 [Vibrio splendidus 12B01]|nr:hypothetical protein V12B01_13695 [Vibrio splendidus 12B01]